MADNLPEGFQIDPLGPSGGQGGGGPPPGFVLDEPHAYGTMESAGEGFLKGASANWRDEIYGASKASGLPDIIGGFRAPIGAARLAYEHFTQPKSITGLVTGDMRGPIQKEYEKYRDEKRREEEAMQQQHPTAFGAGELGGAGVSMLGAPEIAPARMLAGPLGRAGAAMASGAGYGAVSGAGEAETTQDILPEATKSAAVGTLLGGAGSVATDLATPLVKKASSLYHGLVDPEAEAVRRYARASQADASSAGDRLTPQDIQLAQRVGMPIGPVDTSGQAVRELARTASNFSPEAQTALREFTQDRFEQQSPRIAGFIREITGGADAAGDLEILQGAAKRTNRPAYKAAYAAGENGLWTPELERLVSSPSVRQAMQNAVQRGSDRAVAEGMGGFNPGVTFENGIMQFGRGKGAPPYPNMQYWDYVQRELRDMQSAARRTGRNEEAGALGTLHRSLLAELDNANPAFRAARQGAAGFFGAENALDAGQNFVKTGADIAGARQALKRMSIPEQELFARGYASKLADAVERIGDNRNVLINQVFNSVAGRQRTQLALGPGRAQQLEALLRVEGLVDQSRKVLGNSTTARQMIAAAAFGAGGDYALEGHFDAPHMLTAALAGAGLPHAYQQVGQLVSRRVATQLGKLLTSQNPVDLARGAKIASREAAVMRRLRQLTAGGIPSAGTAAGTELLHQKPGQGFKHGGKINRAKGKTRQAGGRTDGGPADAISEDQDQALSRSMTHYPESPNPAQPYLQGTKDFLKGGISQVLRGQGVQLPDWSNRISDVAQSEGFNTAIGMATPLKGLGAVEEAAAAAEPSITAYHGSPHDFDRFDFSKIGTGEGAQAYGWGGYFAENEGVARDYRSKLGKFASDVNKDAYNDAELGPLLRAADAKSQALREQYVNAVNSGDQAKISSIRSQAAEADKARESVYQKAGEKYPPGRMYQVSIKADPEHFLDYDKPFNEQPQSVKEAIWKAGGGTKSHVSISMDSVLADLGDDVRAKRVAENKAKFEAGEMTQYDYNRANQTLHNMRDDALVSDALRAAGIPGIKYLDQGSRNTFDLTDLKRSLNYWQKSDSPEAGARIKEVQQAIAAEEAKPVTRNFVVFDDRLIDIMKKYGIAGIGALPALGMYHYQDKDLPKGRARGGRVPGELTESNKHSHEEVGYVSVSPRKKQRCELCTKFIPDGPACKRVQSPIASGAWCRRFVLKT